VSIANLQNQIDSLKSQITELENNASSDNATIISLLSNATYLETELDNILNWSSSVTNMIMSDPSPWENSTVIVGGDLSGIIVQPAYEQVPWTNELFTDNQSIGVFLGANVKFVNMSTISLGQVFYDFGPAMIYGMVEKGEVSITGLSSETTYYINAEEIVLLGNAAPSPPPQIIIIKP
jgi:hypothetical protein